MNHLNHFNENVFIIKKNLFSHDEIEKLLYFVDSNFESSGELKKTNSTTGKIKLTLWNYPPDNLVGKFTTNERIVKPMENLLE